MTENAVKMFKIVKYYFAISLILMFSSFAEAQLSGSSMGLANKEISKPIAANPISMTASVSATAKNSRALEEQVDPEKYILGPGDVLGVAFRGGLDAFYKEAITPEGNLMIPLAPMIKIGGQKLSDAISNIKSEWASIFPGTQLDITLLEIRIFRVTVSGAVVHPGVYEASPADRASSIIYLAGGLLDETYWRDYYKDEISSNNLSFVDLKRAYSLQLSSKRNCKLLRKDGTELKLDLLSFERGLVPVENPTLLEGDRIVVSYISDNSAKVEIAGAVTLPGSYELREGDKVSDLLNIAGGTLPEAKLDSVQLSHFSSNGRQEVVELNLSDTSSECDLNRLLEKGDLLNVRFKQNHPRRIMVEVRGEVRYPGTYPAVFGESRLSEIIEMAGGFTENAMLRGASVNRQREVEGFLEIETRRIKDRPSINRLTIDEQFKILSERWGGKDRVGVDFVELYENGDVSYDCIVKNGDIIQIPSIETNVLIMGMVQKPGLYPYVEGWNYKDYIEKAGGYVKNARPGIIRLVPYESAIWQLPKTSSYIGPGDMIFIPEAPDRFGWTTFKDIFMVASQAATVLVVILNFSS